MAPNSMLSKTSSESYICISEGVYVLLKLAVSEFLKIN